MIFCNFAVKKYHCRMNDIEINQSKIYELRGCCVMLDFDLALLYQVETRVLNQVNLPTNRADESDLMCTTTIIKNSTINHQNSICL